MKRHNQSCSERTRQQNGDQFSGKSRFLVYIVSMFTLVLCLRSNRLAFALFRFFARRILPSWPHGVIIFCVFFLSFLSLPSLLEPVDPNRSVLILWLLYGTGRDRPDLLKSRYRRNAFEKRNEIRTWLEGRAHSCTWLERQCHVKYSCLQTENTIFFLKRAMA